MKRHAQVSLQDLEQASKEENPSECSSTALDFLIQQERVSFCVQLFFLPCDVILLE